MQDDSKAESLFSNWYQNLNTIFTKSSRHCRSCLCQENIKSCVNCLLFLLWESHLLLLCTPKPTFKWILCSCTFYLYTTTNTKYMQWHIVVILQCCRWLWCHPWSCWICFNWWWSYTLSLLLWQCSLLSCRNITHVPVIFQSWRTCYLHEDFLKLWVDGELEIFNEG